jgi:uncharacterized spore protein YtfJ
MSVLEQFATTVEGALNVKRVFGEPYVKDGLTVIPTARVMGGFGAGEGAPAPGEEGTTAPSGTGGASFLRAFPSGVFVIKDDKVRWLPAVDVNRLFMGMQVFAIVALFIGRSIVRARAKALAPA